MCALLKDQSSVRFDDGDEDNHPTSTHSVMGNEQDSYNQLVCEMACEDPHG